MAKRYKLVPENLVRRFMQQHQHGEDTPSSNPTLILKQTIPDDLKILLYGDAARDVNLKSKRKREAPLLVKSMEEPPKFKPVDRIQQFLNNQKSIGIHNFLNTHGITYNDDDEVVINGVPVQGSYYPMVIRGLQNYAIGYQPGMKEVIDALPISPPDASKAVMIKYKTGTTTAATTSSSTAAKSKSRKIVVYKKTKVPKQKGAGWKCIH
jgi:hypothetical protein